MKVVEKLQREKKAATCLYVQQARKKESKHCMKHQKMRRIEYYKKKDAKLGFTPGTTCVRISTYTTMFANHREKKKKKNYYNIVKILALFFSPFHFSFLVFFWNEVRKKNKVN